MENFGPDEDRTPVMGRQIDANYSKLERFRGQRAVRSETALRARLKSGQRRAEGTSSLYSLLSLYMITAASNRLDKRKALSVK